MKAQLNTLLQREMDRKDFLKTVGIGVMALVGVTTVFKALAPAPTSRSQGYGGSAYGGPKLAK